MTCDLLLAFGNHSEDIECAYIGKPWQMPTLSVGSATVFLLVAITIGQPIAS